MLKEMGNQNATAIIEEEKDTNEAPENPSNENNTTEENQIKNDQLIPKVGSQELVDHEEDQILDHTKEQDEYNDVRGVNSVEPISNETQEIENQESAIKDDDVEDQEIEDTTLDAKTDDHAFEKIKEDLSLNGTSSSIDEIIIQGTEEEIGHLMVAKMSESEEENVIDEVDISEQSSAISKNQEVVLHSEGLFLASLEASSTKDETIGLTIEDEGIKASTEEENDEHKIASEMKCSDEEIGDQIEVVKSVMNLSLDVERYDNDNNNPDSPKGSEYDEAENFYEEEEKKDQGISDHVADFKHLEMVDTKDAPDCTISKEDDETEHFHEFVENSEEEEEEEEKDAGNTNVSDFKDLEVVDTKSSPDCKHNTQSQIEKSPSFNFEFKNSVTRTEESDQTPLLYSKKKAPMRSLSTPVNGRFITPIVGQERTINIVDYDQKPRTPLNGLLKDQEEEAHLLKPQKIHQEAENTVIQKELCNGNYLLQQGSIDQKRNKSSKVSGSYFFSSCICCSGVQELADP